MGKRSTLLPEKRAELVLRLFRSPRNNVHRRAGQCAKRGSDQFGRAGERKERRINQGFQSLGAAERDSACGITRGGHSINVMLCKRSMSLKKPENGGGGDNHIAF